MVERLVERLFVILLVSLELGACAAKEPALPADIVQCRDPRPEVCTMEWNPVCGVLEDGSRKTYPTGCTACSHNEVVGWLAGECP